MSVGVVACSAPVRVRSVGQPGPRGPMGPANLSPEQVMMQRDGQRARLSMGSGKSVRLSFGTAATDWDALDRIAYVKPNERPSPQVGKPPLRVSRLFVGDDLDLNDGGEFYDLPGWPARQGQDWGDLLVGGASSTARLSVLGKDGYGGIAAYSQTLGNPLAASMGSWAVYGSAHANKVGPFNAYGILAEAYRYGNAGSAHAIEADGISRPALGYGTGSITTPLLHPGDAYSQYAIDVVRATIGRPDYTDCGDVSHAYSIINNTAPSRWGEAGRARVGWTVHQPAILGRDGNFAYATEGDAIALGRRHIIGWWDGAKADATAASAYITSSATTNGSAIEFADGGVIIRTPVSGGQWHHIFDRPPDITHTLRHSPASAGWARIYVEGPGAANLRLSAKGYASVTLAAGDDGAVTAFRATATTGHNTFLEALASLAGYATTLRVVGPAGADSDLALRPLGDGLIDLPNAVALTYAPGSIAPSGSWVAGFFRAKIAGIPVLLPYANP